MNWCHIVLHADSDFGELRSLGFSRHPNLAVYDVLRYDFDLSEGRSC